MAFRYVELKQEINYFKLSDKMLNKNTYFQTDPLVARKFIVAPCPYSLIVSDFINTYCPENKGIREDGAAVIPATKGFFKNKD